MAAVEGLCFVVQRMGDLGLQPMDLRYEAYTGSEGCLLTITFHSVEDLQTWCRLESATMEHVDRTTSLGHHEYTALYSRGRRVLAVARAFPEMPRWTA